MGACYGWSVQAQGRLAALSDVELRIEFLDKLGRITLSLDQEDLGFEYAEPKDAKPDLTKNAATEKARRADCYETLGGKPKE
jgi:hypothetical protein